MSKQANKTLIGAFVLGAIVLIVAGVLVFGSGRFFKQTKKFVLYFDGSVKGLQIGSPVTFRGVSIGQVTDIAIEVNMDNLSSQLPVYIEIDPEKMRIIRGTPKEEKYYYIKPLIEKGLKAQLQLYSLVTGQLLIDLDFYPEKPARLAGVPGEEYLEIPTMPSDVQEFAKMLTDLPLKEVLAKLNSTLAGIDRIANSPNIGRSLESLSQVIKKLDRIVAQNENFGYLAGQMLEDLSRMSRSLRSLADYLDRHPEALIKGKSPGEGE